MRSYKIRAALNSSALNLVDCHLIGDLSNVCCVRTPHTVSAMASLTCANLTASKSSLAGRRITCARGKGRYGFKRSTCQQRCVTAALLVLSVVTMHEACVSMEAYRTVCCPCRPCSTMRSTTIHCSGRQGRQGHEGRRQASKEARAGVNVPGTLVVLLLSQGLSHTDHVAL